MSWYLVADNLCIFLGLFIVPKRGWSLGKTLISLILVTAGALILLIASGATTLTFAVTSLSAGVLILAEMTRGSRYVISFAWIAGGVLLIVLNWEKSALGEWADQWRRWLAIGGLAIAFTFGAMAWRSARIARGKYGDLGGV